MRESSHSVWKYELCWYGVLTLCLLGLSSVGGQPACAAGESILPALSGEEREWLEKHPVITLGAGSHSPPLEFFDEQGVYRGIAADFVSLIQNMLGVRLRILRFSSHEQIMDKVRTREVDILGAAEATQDLSESMIFTTPYVEFPSVIITTSNVRKPLTLKDLEGMEVAVVTRSPDQDYISRNYPSILRDEVPNVQAGLRKTSFGMVDALVANLGMVTHHMNKEGITNLQVAGDAGFSHRLSFASRSDWPLFGLILDKALARVSLGEKERIFDKWFHVAGRSFLAREDVWVTILAVLGLVCVMLVAALTWNRSLKALVDQKTEQLRTELAHRERAEDELRRAHDELEVRVRERTSELLTEMEEHKRTEDALRRSEERFRTIFESAQEMVFLKDLSLRYSLVNPAMERLYGIQSSRFVGSTDRELFGQAADGMELADARVLGGEVSHEEHTQLIGGCCEVVLDVVKAPIRDHRGSIVALCGVARDVTERRRAEEKLRESEERFRQMFDKSLAVKLLVDPANGDIIDANPAASDFYGYSKEELRGSSIFRLNTLPPYLVRQEMVKALREEINRFQFKHRLASGLIRDVEIHSSALDFNGRKLLYSIIHDITDRNRAKAALLESEDRLRQLSARLLAVQEEERKRIACELHDSIGQSLAAIKFSVESSLRSLEQGKERVDRDLERLVPKIQNTIEETRRIYMGLRPSILDDLGITATLRWFCREFQLIYPAHHIEQQVEVDESQIPEHLKIVIFRILQESLNNIAKYSHAELISVRLMLEHRILTLIIEDNGVGFTIPNVLETGMSRRKGLGLTSMKERTELSNGSFFVTSIPGEGTTIQACWSLES